MAALLDTRPFRSVLYIPGSKERALEKACGLATDAIIFDLEDAVAVDEKAKARETLANALAAMDFGPRAKLVRLNGFDTDWAERDLEVISLARPEAVLLPKVNSAADIEALAAKLDARAELGRLGLNDHLSAQRSNGLRAMVERIRGYAAAA